MVKLQIQNEKFVADGWDRYIISPAHVSEKENIVLLVLSELMELRRCDLECCIM